MESADFEEKAIQLVSVTPEGKYELHPTAEMFLRKIPKPIAVISVAGLYRTGKSYLLNRILLNRNNGFGVGPTINPCTKGLWCWGVPLKGTTSNGEKINVLIIDSEGIGALDEDQNHDIKIFTLAILTSSIFIYNSVGSIDENALQNLSMVVNLTKNIQLNTQSDEEEDPDELARYFPTFFWVVRDFSLQLVSSEGDQLTSKDYLERALAPQKGFSDDIEEKNRIRRLLTAFFKDRECATLVRPLVNEQKLQHLYECSFDDLRPQFVDQALALRKKVLTNVKPKMLKGEHLDGTMYLSMLNSYLNAINNGGVPNIQNAWTYMCIQKCMKLQQQCYDFLIEEIDQRFSDNLPCPVGEFEAEMQNIQSECFKMFESEEIGEESASYFQELKEKVKEKINLMRIENERQSINFLKNYIIKNFTVIEKKMKMNEYETFQQYLKSINNFYLYLVENGPDLPKKEIVYLDFLKKVTTQGAQIFIKQLNNSLESTKNLSLQKQKMLKKQIEELKLKIKADMEKFNNKLEALSTQKFESQKKLKQVMQKFESLKITSSSEINKLEQAYTNKLKIMELKVEQASITIEDLKLKKQTLQTSFILEKKQREKQKALLELKMNQYKNQLAALKIKQKNQEIYINDMGVETTHKIKEMSFQYEKKITTLSNEVNTIKQMYNETLEVKEDLQSKLKTLEMNFAFSTKKYQEDLKAQIDKFEYYKNNVQTEKVEQNKKLELQNHDLEANLGKMSEVASQYERQIKNLTERLKTVISQSEKQIAILTQKIDFLTQQAIQTKQKFNKSFEHYEGMLKSQSQMKEEELRTHYRSQYVQMQEQYLSRIHHLEGQLVSLKEKYIQQTSAFKKNEDNYKFSYQVQQKRLQNEIYNQASTIQHLEAQVKRLETQKVDFFNEMEEKFESRQSYYEDRIGMLQNELQIAKDLAMNQQSEMNSKLQENLKQLKNFHQLQKERLQQKGLNEKEKYEKKISELRESYKNQIDQIQVSYQQKLQTLQEEYLNEKTVLNNLVVNLQHDIDSKAKLYQNLEVRFEQIKLKLEKKEIELANKIESMHKAAALEKQALQQKIIDANEQRSKLQKDIVVINYQKDQLSKEIKDLTSKCEVKTEEIFYLNKSMEKINNQARQKLNDLNNEYMNQRLNYEKKIALGQQQKQFYAKKIEQYEKEQAKNSIALEELTKKLTNDAQQQMKALQQKKNAEYSMLESKYEKLKKLNKENEQLTSRNVNELQKQLALQQQKYNNLLEKYEQLEQKRSNDGNYLANELNSTKQQLARITKETSDDISKLKKQLNDVTNQKNQIQVLYEKDKILLQNKNNYLQQTKQKNKKEYLEKIRNLQLTIQNIQKNRINDKNYYESNHSENIAKIERKYNNIIQQNNENWTKKERQYESQIKNLQNQIRTSNEKMGKDLQTLTETNKAQERKLRQLQQSQRRNLNELEKLRLYKQSSSSENQSLFERERQTMRQKLQQKQQKYKTLEKAKQEIYYSFQKEKARWNLEKQNYLMRNDQLKELISKQERDMQKLNRENQKLKAQKKCSKISGLSSLSKYSLERANSKYSLQDSINSISMSTSKQNCNPLGELSFFNNQ